MKRTGNGGSLTGSDFVNKLRRDNLEIASYLKDGKCVFRLTQDAMCGQARSSHKYYCKDHIQEGMIREARSLQIIEEIRRS